MEGLVGGLAIIELAPDRYRPLHAERGKEALLEVWPFSFALALGHRQRQGLPFSLLISAPDAARGGIKVPIAALQAKPGGRPDRTGRQEPHGAKVGETIEDPARGIVIQGLRGHRLAEEQGGVLLSAELCQAG